MEAKYFNEWEFKQAQNLVKTDPEAAIKEFERYLKNYPTDYCAHSYYASALLILNDVKASMKTIHQIEKDLNTNNINLSLDKIERIESSLVINKMKLLAYQEKYEELKQFYYEHIQDEKMEKYFDILLFYCNKKLGTLNIAKENIHSYLLSQIFDYNERNFKLHIKKHLSGVNEETRDPSTAIFAEDFPLEKILEEIKKYIPSDKKLFMGYIDDRYIFKFDECGRDGKKLVNHFKVIALHNTCDLITMFPSEYCEKLPYTDLNYLKEKKEEPQIKKLSQIDKFNKRYNK